MDLKTPLNPSRKATARVKNPLPAPSVCRICNGKVRIAHHDEIYGKAFGDWPYAYLCGDCGAYVGMHPFTAIPLGTLADKRTREARKQCKAPFEKLWREGVMSRTEAYHWLASEMNIATDECHFGWFDANQCYQAMSLCLKRLAK